MAKVVRISYERGDTIKIGDFELLRPIYGETWELEEGEDPDKLWKKLVRTVDEKFHMICRRQLQHNLKRRVNERDEETQDYIDEACDYFKVKQVKQGRPQRRK